MWRLRPQFFYSFVSVFQTKILYLSLFHKGWYYFNAFFELSKRCHHSSTTCFHCNSEITGWKYQSGSHCVLLYCRLVSGFFFACNRRDYKPEMTEHYSKRNSFRNVFHTFFPIAALAVGLMDPFLQLLLFMPVAVEKDPQNFPFFNKPMTRVMQIISTAQPNSLYNVQFSCEQCFLHTNL